MKSWNYEEITQEAERRIVTLIENRDSQDRDMEIRKQWAYGVYLGWNSLCMGWMKPSDDERLKSLVNNTESK